jgi:uncharacterized protein
MSASKSAHEPSMEEILASIRRIISEDGETTKIPASSQPPMKDVTPPTIDAVAKPVPPPPRPFTTVPPPPPPPPGAAAAVLELTDMIGEDGRVVNLKANGHAAPQAATMAPPPPPPPQPQPAASPAAQTSNLPAPTRAVTALQELQSAARQAAVSDAMLVPVGNLGHAFEELVREQLQPMLQTWIDQNLPSVIERQVQKEIERISRQAADG